VFCHDGTGTMNPFGRTRITRFVRTLTDDAIRCMWHMQVAGAYYSVPKLMLTNLTARQYDAMMEDKDKYQLDRLLLAEQNPDGSTMVPTQLSGNSPQPFVDELRALACQFSGATGVPLNSLGIVQDNPSSAEAIQAAREDICLVAEDDIAADKWTLRRVAMCAMAVNEGIPTDQLTERQRSVSAHFANPTIPSLNARASFVQMVSSVDDGFGKTSVGREMLGFDSATIARLESDEVKAATADMARQIFGGAPNGSNTEGLDR